MENSLYPVYQWIKTTITRKDKEMDKITSADHRHLISPGDRENETMTEPYGGSGGLQSSKTPDPSFEDVQEKGREYYEQDTLVFYRSELLNDVKAKFTRLIIELEKCNRNETLLDELCIESLIGDSILAIGAICDVFELDLKDIVHSLFE